jgi:hypothetical protein
LLLAGDCEVGEFEQRIVLSAAEEDVLDVSTRLKLHQGTTVNSVEDRYDFMPERHSTVNAEQGPLDFVWSQNIKSEPDDLIPTYAFKSATVMLQQDAIFVALMPELSSRRVEPLALDLNVTSEKRPWISFGQIPSQPHDTAIFAGRRIGIRRCSQILCNIPIRFWPRSSPRDWAIAAWCGASGLDSDMNLCSTLLVCSRTLSGMNCARSLPGAMRHGT